MENNNCSNCGYSRLLSSFKISGYNRQLIPILLLLTIFCGLCFLKASALCPALQEKYREEVIQENISFPETAAARKAETFWKAFKSEDRAALEVFFQQVLPEEKLREMSARDRAQRILGHRQKLGSELRALQVLAPGPKEISIIASDSKNNLFRLTLAFEKQGQELRLKSLTIDEAGPEDLASPLPGMSLARALQGIEEEIGRAVLEDRFSGVVLIARDFQPIYFKPYGLASKELMVPNQRDFKFNLGSINKIFTKIAIARLAQEGRLSLDDKLGKFLPDYPNAEAREKVTVRHLVNMTSGIGDFFGPEFRSTPKDLIRHNRDYLKLFATKPLAFEPGSREMYSNGGYVVLGEIISAASGMDYYEYIRKNIFEPAGMKDSDWFEADAVVPNLAEGYTKQSQQPDEKPSKPSWRRNIYTRPARGSAAGGGYATAEDLLRFTQTLYECRLLHEAWTNWVFTGVEPQSKNNPEIRAERKRWGLGIAGGAPGINAALEFEAHTGFTIIVLANYDPPSAGEVARMIRRYLEAVKK